MMNRIRGLVAALVLSLALPASSFGQSVFATLTGSVVDPSQAVVPNAKVALKNTASGDTRRTVSNQDGYFTFSSIPVGSTYELTVETSGFTTYKATDLTFSGAETKSINISLKVGTTAEAVEVVSAVEAVPTVSGEKSSTLTQKELQNFAIVGRNAAEFIKILPGFSIAGTGTENRTNFTGETIGINGNGDGGSQSPFNGAFSNNGLPTGSLDITADGAHVSDPGCNCATPVNPNSEFIEEFKVLTSNFSAENSKGPAVVTSVGRSGGKDFHGSAYLSARHHSMNSNDWLNNRLNLPKPANKYFFPGGTFSGPVLLPGGFNKNRDKLFFFTGFENFFQTLDTGLIRATVPTEGMRGGNFSAAELRKIEGLVRGNWITSSGAAAQMIDPAKFSAPNGIIPASQIDKNGAALMKLLPLPNADPTATGGSNYVNQIVFNQNSRQWFTRVDYNISDNTKLFVRYNFQNERQLFPIGLWWRNGNQVPYPTEIVGKNRSDSISASLTHVFSPTMTNEFVFGYTFIAFPNVFNDPSKVVRGNVGMDFPGLFKNGVTQIPAMTGWGGEFATMFNPGGFEVGGSRGLFADKHLPTFSNNLTKVWGTHTTKVGVFYEYVINNQPANGMTNGQAEFANWGGNSTNSAYADLLTGRMANYTEQSFNRLNNIGSHIFEGFVQDDWKVNRRLTLNLGLRLSHLGAWYDREGFGFAVFDRALYQEGKGSSDFNGFTWFARNKSYRNGGFGTKVYPAPRVGFAYDVFGSGKTILRGGWGQFYFSDFQFTVGLDVSAGVRSANINNTTFAEVAAARVTGNLPTLAAGVNPNDDKRGRTRSYSLTLSQRLPGSSILEVAYVGNKSDNLLNRAGPGNFTNGINPNIVPVGALFRFADQSNLSTDEINTVRPLRGYQDLAIAQHMLYQNYNSMQASLIRTKGRYNLTMNYTYGKSLGIAGAYDDFNLRNNYGPTASDRRHVFNAAYSIELPDAVKGGASKFAKGALNGWQFTGITQIQSGVNLTANTAGSFNVDFNGAKLANGQNITPATVFGTPSIIVRPVLASGCSPQGDGSGQKWINQNCFSLPTQRGQSGPTILPEVTGPAFFNSDLGLYKNFQISEAKRVQFRFNAYNFLNHPLWSFISGAPNSKLVYNPNTNKFDNPVFGIATEKQGRRLVMLTLKFYF